MAAAVAAGDLLLERFRRPATGVERKSSSTDMVSDADRDAEALIRSLIGERRPGDAVLGEEGGRAAGAGDLLWVVDPLDGTTNYLYRQPVWAVSVACEDAEGGVAGVVHHPCLGETFTAVRGGGAFCNGAPIAVSDVRRPLPQPDRHRLLVLRRGARRPGARPQRHPAAGARRPPRRVGGDRSGLGGLRPPGRVLRAVARVAGTALPVCCWCPRRAASSAR